MKTKTSPLTVICNSWRTVSPAAGTHCTAAGNERLAPQITDSLFMWAPTAMFAGCFCRTHSNETSTWSETGASQVGCLRSHSRIYSRHVFIHLSIPSLSDWFVLSLTTLQTSHVVWLTCALEVKLVFFKSVLNWINWICSLKFDQLL